MPGISVQSRSLVAFGAGLAVALIAVFGLRAWQVDAAPGDSDTTFVPIAPCRLADTRPSPNRIGDNGTLAAGDTRTLAVRGSHGNCAIPADAVGVSLNVTATDATASTFLTFWPEGQRPLTSSLNPAPGQPPTPNAVTTLLSGAGSFNLYNLAGSVNVIIDVTGYHVSGSLEEIESRLSNLEDGVGFVVDALPFASSARKDVQMLVATDGTVVVSLSVPALVDGQVTLNSSVSAFTPTAGQGAVCSIITHMVGAAPVPDAQYSQRWESAGASGSKGVLAGTRVFDIAAGATATYSLICYPFGPLGTTVELDDAVLTAIYTPAQ